jgi:hypothetical protein
MSFDTMRAVSALVAVSLASTMAACVGGTEGAGSGLSGETEGSGTNTVSGVSRLSVSGTQILDPSKKPVVLRGWNWGQWGSVQPQDGTDAAAQGATVVRILLRWWGQYGDAATDSRDQAVTSHINPANLATLDQAIQEAANAHLWVDLAVDSNCGQASVNNDTVAYCGAASDGSPANFYNTPAMKQEFIEVWQFLVARYKNTPYIGMYEILPEPSFTCSANGCKDYTSAPTFYASVIPHIRAIDPVTPILVGPDNGYDVRQMATAYIPGVSGLIYTADFLSFASQHPEWLSNVTSFRTARNVPIFTQQLGVPSSSTNAETTADTMFTDLAADGIGWTWWTYREMHNPNGGGYAPFYLDGNNEWQKNMVGGAPWLNTITSHLK